jgi:hypothetical protein
MKLVRTVFVALAILLPVSWTVAQAADPAPPAAETTKADKKEKKAKKADAPIEGDKKSEPKADKK